MMNKLPENKVNEIVDLYLNQKDTISVREIIARYNLNISSNQLRELLPLVRSDKSCPYCGTVMYRKIVSRGHLGDPYCKTCGHIFYSDSENICRCRKCDEGRREFIKNVYGKEQPKINFSDLSLDYMVLVVKLIKQTGNFDIIRGEMFWNLEIERKILLQKSLISVSPDSPVNAFDIHNFPYSFFVYEVDYKINIRFSQLEKEAILEDTYLFGKLTEEEKYKVFYRCLHADVMKRFKSLMKARRLEPEILPTAEQKFKELYKELSYSKIITLCDRVARFCSDKVITRKMNRKAAERGALRMVVNFWEKSKRNGWTVADSEIGDCGNDLKWCIESIMGKELTVLNEVVNFEKN